MNASINFIQTVFLSIILSSSSAFATSISDIEGAWFAEDSQAVISALEVVEEATSGFAVGTIRADGKCWQCDGEQANLFQLPMDSFAVLPVARMNELTEALEVRLEDDGSLTAVLTYRAPPTVCNPPFNCLWEVVDQISVVLNR